MRTIKQPSEPGFAFDSYFRVRQASQEKLKSALGAEYVEWQVFVPAGRSFFTSLGKAVTAFEYSGLFDPITVRFGRFFTSLSEFSRQRYLAPRTVQSAQALTCSLFGGDLRLGREQQFLETEDGRKIPFAFLSSGQQELLPLWFTLEYVRTRVTTNGLVYIEEPEAHLFPAAQSQVIEQLANAIRRGKSGLK